MDPVAHNDVASIEQALRAAVRGDVSFDALTRGIHATDASHYQVTPTCVVWPRDAADARAAIEVAGRHNLPITARGAGTSLSGQTMWSGMVLDFSRHMDGVLEINLAERWARVQPGVIRDQLNEMVKAAGLHFAPDPATGNRATIGGMIANNSSGMRSILHGMTVDHLLEATVALADGTLLELGPEDRPTWEQQSAGDGRGAAIRRGLQQIVEREREEIVARYPQVLRRVSGYCLDRFVDDAQPWNLAALLAGSEGTLGVVLEAKVKLSPLPAATSMCIVHFNDVRASLEAVAGILEHGPAAVELIDRAILNEARKSRACAAMAEGFLQGDPAVVLVVEFWGESADDVREKAEQLAATLQRERRGYAWPIRTDEQGQADVWTVRKLGNGLANNIKGPRKRQALIEDACVPVAALPDYVMRTVAFCESLGSPVVLFGHASVGVIHVSPMLDLHRPGDLAKMRQISEFAFALVRELGGAWSGEHGDGLVRGEFIPRFFGPRIYQAFREVKGLFDPQNLMNPGKIVDAPAMTTPELMRYGPQYRVAEVPSNFAYREQGSFALAVEQCNGVGACRKLGQGTMCPSYMATREEEHSTRGWANALRLAMSGQLGEGALTSDRLHQTLDLCLQCKGCKGECPNTVDVARLKSDVLQMRHDERGTPLSARLMGAWPTVARRVAGPMAPVVNLLQRARPVRWMLSRVAGVDRRRQLPAFARQSLQQWFGRRERKAAAGARARVVLFDDTYASYVEPAIGRAAVELLEGCGYEVVLARAGCCQRPRISKGLLHEAKRAGEQTLRRLDEYVRQGLTIVCLEPSCASALTDDLPDLIDDAALGQRVAGAVKMIDVFLAEEMAAGRLSANLHCVADELLVHGHCHQKALFGAGGMITVLHSIPGVKVREIDSGCCGMAGSFGHEHYDLSMKIGEDRLFPAVRARAQGEVVVACGFSCREQLRDGCSVRARHFVEVVRVNTGV